jgi:hypothetical protein
MAVYERAAVIAAGTQVPDLFSKVAKNSQSTRGIASLFAHDVCWSDMGTSNVGILFVQHISH